MKKYLIEKLWTFEYDYDMAVVKVLLKNNHKKWNVSFVEFDVKNFIKEGDIVKGKLFIQYVCESLKVDSELRAVQPFPKSPHIEAVVRVVKHINSYSLLVESAISDSEILVEFENDVAYEKDDVIFFEGELSFEFL